MKSMNVTLVTEVNMKDHFKAGCIFEAQVSYLFYNFSKMVFFRML